MSLLEVSNLSASYGGAEILHDISFTVEKGAVAVILGANGAGKTTILRALSGIVEPRGSVVFSSRPLRGMSIEAISRLGISHVPQGRGTFGSLTVEENLKAGGIGRTVRQVKASIRHWYEFFPHLAERAHQQASTLSGGEQQMLAIARALVAEPRLLLLDEPSLGLSPKMTQTVFAGLQTINRESGTTMLVVEQNAHLSLGIATTAIVVGAGRVVSQGLATDLKNNDDVRRAYLGY